MGGTSSDEENSEGKKSKNKMKGIPFPLPKIPAPLTGVLKISPLSAILT